MKTFQRIMAVVLALVMSLSVIGVAAFAAETTSIFDDRTTGSLTIVKLEKGEDAVAETPSTGVAIDTLPTGYTVMEGVEFTVYQIMTQAQFEAYLNNTDTTTELKPEDYYTQNADGSYTVEDYSGAAATGVAVTTNENGVAEFDTLKLGVYLVIETKYPAKVTSPMKPFLVSIPMTDPADVNEWLYDVTVYPKNDTSEGTVKLTKKNADGTGIQGVVFELKKGTTDDKGVTTYPATGTQYTTGAGGVLADLTLTPGKYSLAEVSAPNGYIVDQRPIYFEVTEDNTIVYDTENADVRTAGDKPILTLSASGAKTLNITLVNDKPDLDKVIVEDGKDTHEANTGAFEDISYKITADVPVNITDLKTFVVTDTSRELTYNMDSIALVCDGAAVDADAYAVTAIYDDDDDEHVIGYTITFVPSEMGAYAGKEIVVTYTADGEYDVNDGKIINNAELTYSNKIKVDSTADDGDGDKNHIEDKAVVYVYKATIVKYKDAVKEGNELENVEFQLKTSDGKYVVFTSLASMDRPGEYVYFRTNDNAVDSNDLLLTTLKTNSDGEIILHNLDPDATYYLVETKTIDGYNLLDKPVEIEITLDSTTTWTESSDFVQNADGSWTLVKREWSSVTYKNEDGSNATNNVVSQNVVNKKGFTLPQTGGIGTLMFIILGGVLIAGGVCLIAVPNKKRSV